MLGFRDLGRPDAAWLSTAIAEMLRTELAAGQKVRTIPAESEARMKVELAHAYTGSLARATLARVRSNVGADLVVLGSYLSLGPGGRLRLDVRLQDTTGVEILASAAEEATEQDVFGLVSRAGERLRETLALGELTAEEADAVRASAHNLKSSSAPTAPTLSNVRSSLIQLNDSQRCTLSTPYGSSFQVVFDYTDVNGNGPTNISQAALLLSWVFVFGGPGSFSNYQYLSSVSTPNGGSTGTVTTTQCYRFGSNTYVDVTMSIQDLTGLRSGDIALRIPRPSGSN